MWKVFVGLAILLSVLVIGGYKYFSGNEYEHYEEAKRLESEGKITEAHEEVLKALEENPTNRKILAYKAQLFSKVENYEKYKKAVSYRDSAVRAMDRGDYIEASEKLELANNTVYNVSQSSESYKLALELQAQIVKDAERLKKELPEKYYNKAMELSNDGEYERAYNALLYIKNPTNKIIGLKDQLAYKIGLDKMESINKDKDPTTFLINDAIFWFNQVSKEFPKYPESKLNIHKLKEKLEKANKANIDNKNNKNNKDKESK